MRNCNRLLVTFLYNIFLQDAVVINQPLAPPSKVDAGHTRAKEHFILTVVMMLLCFLHGNLLAFICLIPAFLFSRMVNDFAWLYWTNLWDHNYSKCSTHTDCGYKCSAYEIALEHHPLESKISLHCLECWLYTGHVWYQFYTSLYSIQKRHKLCTEKGYTEQSTSSKPYNLVYCWMANLEN